MSTKKVSLSDVICFRVIFPSPLGHFFFDSCFLFSCSLLFQGNRCVFYFSTFRQENDWDVDELFEQLIIV